MGKISLKNGILALCFVLFGGSVFGQEDVLLPLNKIKIKAALSYSPGFLTENTRTIQVQGYLGIRPKQGRVELRGDGFYFLNSVGDRPRFSMNHQLYVGGFYRFSDKAFQPYVGLQPGLAYAQSSEFGTLNQNTGEITYKKSVNPVGSVVGGFGFFAEKAFFMFLETRYIFGKHKSDTYPVFLDELRFSFGLGLHI